MLVPLRLLALSTDPVFGQVGEIYINTVTKNLRVHNGTTWTTRITGNAIIYLGEKNAIEGNYDSWLRLNNSSQYASGVYTPGVMRADGGFNVSGSTVWHAGNDGSGSGLDADLLDGQNSTEFLRLLSGGAEASLDSYTDNGFRSVSFAGHSQHLLSWNAGGSTGTVQQLFHYGTPNNGWRIRNKTDKTLTIPKDIPLFSKDRFIRLELAFEILNEMKDS